MGDTAKRAVESTNVPQLMTALRGRVELAEERLNNMADKSFRALEDELTGVRTEVRGVVLAKYHIRLQKMTFLFCNAVPFTIVPADSLLVNSSTAVGNGK